MTFDASLLGSHNANMATYALYILVIFLINNFYEQLETPLDVYRKFISYFVNFDWSSRKVTIYGPVNSFDHSIKSIEEQALEERAKDPELKN